MEHLFFVVEFLEKEITAYKELLALAHQEKDAVIKNDVQSVSAIVEKQRSLLVAVKKLEAEREDAALKAGVKEGGRLKAVIETAHGGLRDKLKGLMKELESTAAKVRRAGALNKTLIDTQLQYTSYCLNLLTGERNPLNTYSGSGRMNGEGTAQPRLVDQTI